MDEVKEAAEIVKAVGLAEFVVLVAVIIGAVFILKVWIPRKLVLQHEDVKYIKGIVEETQALENNNALRFERLEENIARNTIHLKEIAVESTTTLERLQEIKEEYKEDYSNINKNVLRLMVSDKSLDIYSKIKAGLDYIRMGGNNTTRDALMKLAIKNPDAWNSVLNQTKEYHESQAYFNDTVNRINSSITSLNILKDPWADPKHEGDCVDTKEVS